MGREDGADVTKVMEAKVGLPDRLPGLLPVDSVLIAAKMCPVIREQQCVRFPADVIPQMGFEDGPNMWWDCYITDAGRCFRLPLVELPLTIGDRSTNAEKHCHRG